jgi:hypothetical protein
LTGEIAIEVTGVVGVSPALWYFRYIASIFLTLHKRLWLQVQSFSFKQNIIYLRFTFSVMMVECKINWIVCRQYQVAFYSKVLKDAIPSSVVPM